MKIMVDGDSAHRLADTERIAARKNIPCHIYCDTSRCIESSYSEVHIVDIGSNSADMAIVNKCEPGDIVITNDIGLAAMVLTRHAYAMNNYGLEYTDENIMSQLSNRHLRAARARKTGKKQISGNTGARPEHGSFRSTLTKLTERTVDQKS